MRPVLNNSVDRRKTPLLRMHQITRGYGDVVAVEAVDLEVWPGECVALIGHNGSGKTTTIRVAAGFLESTSGSVEVNGRRLDTPAEAVAVRSDLAVVGDTPVLYDDLTVGEHLELMALAFGVHGNALDMRMDLLLNRLGLAERKTFVPSELSRGMRQKTQIACALMRPFRLLILDEPVAGLDPPSQRELAVILAECKERGCGILLATHQLEFPRGLADRALILANGRVVAEGEYDTVLAGPVAAELHLS